MTVQVDNRFTRFIQCECRDGRIIFQLDHAIIIWWWQFALIRKRSDWEQSHDHRYSEDDAEDSFAFSF